MQVSGQIVKYHSENWHTIEYRNNSGCPAFCIKWFIVSERIARNRHYFRSFASIDREKQRQLLLPYFIIHPFSEFRFLWETWMALVYLFALLFLPFEACNFFYKQLNEDNFVNYGIPVVVTHLLLIMDIFVSLLTGYPDPYRYKIILERNKIARRYFKTYFFCDLLSTVPALMNAIPLYFLNGKPVCSQSIILNFSKLFRVCTLSEYARNFVIRWHMYGIFYKVLFIIMFSVFFFHWTACGIFVFPFTFSLLGSTWPTQKSWLNTIAVELGEVPVRSLYFASLINAISLTISCTAGPKLTSLLEFFMKFVCAVFGTIYQCYNFVLFFNIIRLKMETQTRYDEFVTGLKDYMRHNQLPASVQQRMLMYYEHRFQRVYFNEQAIMDTLPVSLKEEIREVGILRLLSKVRIFDTIKKEVLQKIVDSFIFRIYLPKDVIKTKGNTIYTYFILHGTVAIYTAGGHEVMHFYDGNYFGMSEALISHKSVTVAVAVDVCEIYLLRKEIFVRAMRTNKEAYANIYREAQMRVKTIKAVETQYRGSDEDDFWNFRYSM